MNSILIVKIAAIGDVVMALPMAMHARKLYPAAKITWLCGKQVGPLVRSTVVACGAVDQVIEVDESALFDGKLYVKCAEISKCWRSLEPPYDLTLIGNSSSAYLALVLPWVGRTQLVRFYPELLKHPTLQYLHMLDPQATQGDIVWPEVAFPSPQGSVPLSQSPRPWVAIAPGGAKNILADDPLRRWPLERYVTLAQKLIEAGVQVFVVGSPSDSWIKPSFEGLFRHPQCHDRVGLDSLVDTVRLFSEMDAVVTHDTGPLHLAQLTRTRLLGLFGPTDPRSRVLKTHKDTAFIWGGEGLRCRPCYDGRTYPPCDHHSCMKAIEVEEVLSQLKDLPRQAPAQTST